MASRFLNRQGFDASAAGAALLAAGLLAVACAGSGPRLDLTVPLERDAPVQGEVRTMDFVLYYRYVFQPGANGAEGLSFTGDLEPRRDLDVLDVRLHLLDAGNAVLASHLLHVPGAFGGVGSASVRQWIPVPPEAVFIAFSHYGREDARRILRDDDRRPRRW